MGNVIKGEGLDLTGSAKKQLKPSNNRSEVTSADSPLQTTVEQHILHTQDVFPDSKDNLDQLNTNIAPGECDYAQPLGQDQANILRFSQGNPVSGQTFLPRSSSGNDKDCKLENKVTKSSATLASMDVSSTAPQFTDLDNFQESNSPLRSSVLTQGQFANLKDSTRETGIRHNHVSGMNSFSHTLKAGNEQNFISGNQASQNDHNFSPDHDYFLSDDAHLSSNGDAHFPSGDAHLSSNIDAHFSSKHNPTSYNYAHLTTSHVHFPSPYSHLYFNSKEYPLNADNPYSNSNLLPLTGNSFSKPRSLKRSLLSNHAHLIGKNISNSPKQITDGGEIMAGNFFSDDLTYKFYSPNASQIMQGTLQHSDSLTGYVSDGYTEYGDLDMSGSQFRNRDFALSTHSVNEQEKLLQGRFSLSTTQLPLNEDLRRCRTKCPRRISFRDRSDWSKEFNFEDDGGILRCPASRTDANSYFSRDEFARTSNMQNANSGNHSLGTDADGTIDMGSRLFDDEDSQYENIFNMHKRKNLHGDERTSFQKMRRLNISHHNRYPHSESESSISQLQTENYDFSDSSSPQRPSLLQKRVANREGEREAKRKQTAAARLLQRERLGMARDDYDELFEEDPEVGFNNEQLSAIEIARMERAQAKEITHMRKKYEKATKTGIRDLFLDQKKQFLKAKRAAVNAAESNRVSRLEAERNEKRQEMGAAIRNQIAARESALENTEEKIVEQEVANLRSLGLKKSEVTKQAATLKGRKKGTSGKARKSFGSETSGMFLREGQNQDDDNAINDEKATGEDVGPSLSTGANSTGPTMSQVKGRAGKKWRMEAEQKRLAAENEQSLKKMMSGLLETGLADMKAMQDKRDKEHKRSLAEQQKLFDKRLKEQQREHDKLLKSVQKELKAETKARAKAEKAGAKSKSTGDGKQSEETTSEELVPNSAVAKTGDDQIDTHTDPQNAAPLLEPEDPEVRRRRLQGDATQYYINIKKYKVSKAREFRKLQISLRKPINLAEQEAFVTGKVQSWEAGRRKKGMFAAEDYEAFRAEEEANRDPSDTDEADELDHDMEMVENDDTALDFRRRRAASRVEDLPDHESTQDSDESEEDPEPTPPHRYSCSTANPVEFQVKRILTTDERNQSEIDKSCAGNREDSAAISSRAKQSYHVWISRAQEKGASSKLLATAESLELANQQVVEFFIQEAIKHDGNSEAESREAAMNSLNSNRETDDPLVLDALDEGDSLVFRVFAEPVELQT